VPLPTGLLWTSGMCRSGRGFDLVVWIRVVLDCGKALVGATVGLASDLLLYLSDNVALSVEYDSVSRLSGLGCESWLHDPLDSKICNSERGARFETISAGL